MNLFGPAGMLDLSRLEAPVPSPRAVLRSIAAAALVASPAGSGATTIHVPSDAPTIRAALGAAAAGDTVVVGCGVWFERNLVLPAGVRLHGETGDPECVRLDGQGTARLLSVAGAGPDTEIRGITFTHGATTTHGAGLLALDSDLRLVDCRFEANDAVNWGGGAAFRGTSSPRVERCVFVANSALYGGGLYLETGSPVVEACLFRDNFALFGGGGVQAWYPTSSSVVHGCTFWRNRAETRSGGGFSVQYGTASLTACTFWRNAAGGPGSAAHVHNGGSLTLDRCIVAGGLGYQPPVGCQGGGTVAVSCTDVGGNSDGNWVGCLAPWATEAMNFTADPLFCDADRGDFTLAAESPCAPDANPCGLVGAHGVACSRPPVPDEVTSRSWGSVKAGYRR
jgi:hypothetical protein